MLLRLLTLLCLLASPIAAQPNVVLILVDDMSMNLMPGPDKPAGYMPNLAAMQADGMTFTRFYTVESLCRARGHQGATTKL
jgi:arylsulfatase A-like enzyme